MELLPVKNGTVVAFSPMGTGFGGYIRDISTRFEPLLDKNNKMTFALSKDSDLSGHPPSLINLRCPHEESLGPWLPIEDTTKTLIRLVGWPGRLIWVIAGCTSYFVALWRAAMFESVLLSKQVCAWWLFGKIFSGTERLMTLKVGMQHRVLEYYQICSNDDPGLTLTYFTGRSNLVHYAFVWKNVKQWMFQKPLLSMISKLVDAVN